jgi:hypothetical protein
MHTKFWLELFRKEDHLDNLGVCRKVIIQCLEHGFGVFFPYHVEIPECLVYHLMIFESV